MYLSTLKPNGKGSCIRNARKRPGLFDIGSRTMSYLFANCPIALQIQSASCPIVLGNYQVYLTLDPGQCHIFLPIALLPSNPISQLSYCFRKQPDLFDIGPKTMSYLFANCRIASKSNQPAVPLCCRHEKSTLN